MMELRPFHINLSIYVVVYVLGPMMATCQMVITRISADECSYYVIYNYRKVSNIRRTKCQHLNDSRLVLQLSEPNPLKPSVKSIMKM